MQRNNRADKKHERIELRTNGTVHEATLWLLIKNRQIEGVKFRRQFSIGSYILDFYAPEVKLCIELDGQGHFTPEGADHDWHRDQYLESLGITVLRVENICVFQDQDALLGAIADTVKELRRRKRK